MMIYRILTGRTTIEDVWALIVVIGLVLALGIGIGNGTFFSDLFRFLGV